MAMYDDWHHKWIINGCSHNEFGVQVLLDSSYHGKLYLRGISPPRQVLTSCFARRSQKRWDSLLQRRHCVRLLDATKPTENRSSWTRSFPPCARIIIYPYPHAILILPPVLLAKFPFSSDIPSLDLLMAWGGF